MSKIDKIIVASSIEKNNDETEQHINNLVMISFEEVKMMF